MTILDSSDPEHYVIVFSRTFDKGVVAGTPQKAGSLEQAEFVARKRAFLRKNCGALVVRRARVTGDAQMSPQEIVFSIGEVNTESLPEGSRR